MRNVDPETVAGFGVEWTHFDQAGVPPAEMRAHFEGYFRSFPWAGLPSKAVGFDAGCGSGRWARFVAEKVGTLHCVDASAEALAVARKNLAEQPNCAFHVASVADMPLAEGSMDFGYSLGVLHHVPDTRAALRACVSRLKRGAPFLLYLYYAFDNRAPWFRLLWRASDGVRRVISRMTPAPRVAVTTAIAASIYWPLARLSRTAESLGAPVDSIPLSFYRRASFYTMRTDALDRFGTRLEQRFTADEIRGMMEQAGLERISFNDEAPFWCALGYRAA